MSPQQRETILSLVGALIVSVPYFIFILTKYQAEMPSGAEELKFWGTAFLIVIPVGILSQIFMHILFEIGSAIATGKEGINEEEDDEMDRLIELKGDRNTMYLFAIGMLLAIGSLAFGYSLATMFSLMFVSGIVSQIVGSLSKLYYYNNGTAV